MAKAVTTQAVRTFANGKWMDGCPPLLSPRDHGVWLSSVVFDAARAIGGHIPDLDKHCARAIKSAKLLGLTPDVTADEIESLARNGTEMFADDSALYISPMFYAAEGFIVPDANSTKFVMTIQEAPLPEPIGFSACLASFRRPARDMAPTEAKASCLYPNVARSVSEAREKGFETGVVLDPNGNVAEFSYANLFMVRDGTVHTPAINGTFLNGITRQRVIQLLTEAGIGVQERAIDYGELSAADELFATGNYAKVMPCTRLDERELQPGPVFRLARELYFKFTDAS